MRPRSAEPQTPPGYEHNSELVVTVDASFPEKLAPLFKPGRYKIAKGGRGGAKSWGFARALLLKGSQEKIRVLCTREFQNSIADSVHKLLSEQIEELGLSALYHVLKTSITSITGTEFIFQGIRNNIDRLKSFEGVDICWVEEAQKVSDDSWKKLIPTIRKKGSEIWISFNPDEETDPTYERFVTNFPELKKHFPTSCLIDIGWKDNPWFPEDLRWEKDYLYAVDPDAAEHVWGGRCTLHSNARVLHGKYRIEAFDYDPLWDGPYFGLDFGFSQDPFALVKCWIAKRRLYIEHEIWKVGLEINDTPGQLHTVEGCIKHAIRADSARPEMISYLKKHGFPKVTGAAKWEGCVEDGIAYLRQFEVIIIHPRCTHTAEEAHLYSYKVDRITGDVLPDIVDKHNHCIDALRYALEPIIKANKTLGMLDWLRQQAEAKRIERNT